MTWRDDRFIQAEAGAITRTLHRYKLNAGTLPAWAVVGGRAVIMYPIRVAGSTTLENVGARMGEVANAISAHRGEETAIRWVATWPPRVEVPHPAPAPLLLRPEHFQNVAPGSALVARAYHYRGWRDVTIDLADGDPHALVVGMTKSGKSALLNVMLASLLARTSPADVRIVAVDLKRSALTWADPELLPHMVDLAMDPDRAAAAVDLVYREMIARRDRGGYHARLLLVVDELAQLLAEGMDRRVVDQLNQIAQLGGGLGVNLWLATQEPTKQILGRFSLANYGIRICGAVHGADTAYRATGIRGSGAETLPTRRGAFLFVNGPDVDRLAGYYVDPRELPGLARAAGYKWRKRQAAPLLVDRRRAAHRGPAEDAQPVVAAPAERDPIEALADRAAAVLEEDPEISKRALALAVGLPQYGGSYAAKLDRALAVLQGRGATTGAATTPDRAGSGPVAAQNGRSGRSSAASSSGRVM